MAAVWTPKRLRLRQWLERKGAGLAEAYGAAVELMGRGPFTGAGSLLAHPLRDLINRLPDAVCGKGPDWMDAGKALDDLRKRWNDSGLPLIEPAPLPDGQAIPPSPERAIPAPLFASLQLLLRERGEITGRRAATAQRLFRELMPPEVEPNPAVIAQWVRLGGWAAGSAHFDASVARDLNWDECCAQLEIFEATLEGLVNQFFDVTDVLDEILEDTNS